MAFPACQVRVTNFVIADDNSAIIIDYDYGKESEGITLGDVQEQVEIPVVTVEEARDILISQANLQISQGCAALIFAMVFSRATSRVSARNQFNALLNDIITIDLDTTQPGLRIGEIIQRDAV